MSMSLCRKAIRTNIPANQRLILIILCDEAGKDDAVVRLSMEDLAGIAGTGVRQTWKLVKKLEAAGFLTRAAKRQGQRNAPNEYQISVAKMEENAVLTLSKRTGSDPEQMDRVKTQSSPCSNEHHTLFQIKDKNKTTPPNPPIAEKIPEILEEKNEEDGDNFTLIPIAQAASAPRLTPARRLLAEGCRILGVKKRKDFSEDEIKMANKALKTHHEEDIIKAFIGLTRSYWHMGHNPRGTKYNKVDQVLRKPQRIDMFMDYADNPPKPDWNTPQSMELTKNAREFYEARMAELNPGAVIDGATGNLVVLDGKPQKSEAHRQMDEWFSNHARRGYA